MCYLTNNCLECNAEINAKFLKCWKCSRDDYTVCAGCDNNVKKPYKFCWDCKQTLFNKCACGASKKVQYQTCFKCCPQWFAKAQ